MSHTEAIAYVRTTITRRCRALLSTSTYQALMDSLSAIEGEYTSIAASQGRALADTDFALSRVAAVEAENAMLRDELARLSMTTAAVKTDSEAIALADTIPGIEPVTVAVAESVPATE